MAATPKGVTPAGTKLKIGQSAVIEYQTGEKGASYYNHGTIQITVTKIQKGDPKIFDQLSNKADFKGMTPYYVITQNKILTYEGKKNGNPPVSPIIYGALQDGSDAGKAISFSADIGCKETYFQTSAPGATATKCTVTLAKTGQQVVGVNYEGDFDLYQSSTANPYALNPLVWKQ